jgi:hypothetical protein
MGPRLLSPFAVNKSNVTTGSKDEGWAYYEVLVIIAKFMNTLSIHSWFWKTKLGLWDHLVICGAAYSPSPLLMKFWMPQPIFMKLFIYISRHLTPSQQLTSQIPLINRCMYMHPRVSLLRNGSVDTFPRQRRSVEGFFFCAVHVVLIENMRLVLARTFCLALAFPRIFRQISFLALVSGNFTSSHYVKYRVSISSIRTSPEYPLSFLSSGYRQPFPRTDRRYFNISSLIRIVQIRSREAMERTAYLGRIYVPAHSVHSWVMCSVPTA